MAVRLTLKEFLEENHLKALQVENNARDKLNLPLGKNTIYRMMSKDVLGKIDLTALNSIMQSLSDILKRTINISEILEFKQAELENNDN